MNGMYEIGDVTSAFREAGKGKKSGEALHRLNLKVICHEQHVERDARLESFIQQPTTQKFFCIVYDNVTIFDRLEIPRDVFNVCAGIGYGAGLFKEFK